MNEDTEEMLGRLLALLILFAICTGFFGVGFYLDSLACDDFGATSGMSTKWIVTRGCMVDYNGNWMHINRYEELAIFEIKARYQAQNASSLNVDLVTYDVN